jgi:hypothetical protein
VLSVWLGAFVPDAIPKSPVELAPILREPFGNDPAVSINACILHEDGYDKTIRWLRKLRSRVGRGEMAPKLNISGQSSRQLIYWHEMSRQHLHCLIVTHERCLAWLRLLFLFL